MQTPMGLNLIDDGANFPEKQQGNQQYRLHFTWICPKCKEVNTDDTDMECSNPKCKAPRTM
jgi:rubrerythrin